MIKDLVLMDYAAVMLTICLLSFIITNDYFAKRTRELFLRACFLLLVLVVADSIEYWTATFNHFSISVSLAKQISYRSVADINPVRFDYFSYEIDSFSYFLNRSFMWV